MNPASRNNPFGYEEAAIVRAMIQHENELRNNRIVWFITIEGLLFAALGFAWKDADWLIYLLCLLGLFTALSSSRELRLSSIGISELKKWWWAWLHQHQPLAYTGPPVIGLDSEQSLSLKWGMRFRPARALPWIFMVAWLAVVCIHLVAPVKSDVHDIRIVKGQPAAPIVP